MSKKSLTVAISGGFGPIHIGHISYPREDVGVIKVQLKTERPSLQVKRRVQSQDCIEIICPYCARLSVARTKCYWCKGNGSH